MVNYIMKNENATGKEIIREQRHLLVESKKQDPIFYTLEHKEIPNVSGTPSYPDELKPFSGSYGLRSFRRPSDLISLISFPFSMGLIR